MAHSKRFIEIIQRLDTVYAGIHVGLDFTTPFELLIATILAAQCTDERVNMVTKTLFKKYPHPSIYVATSIEEIEEDIHSTGFYKNKAANIHKTCVILCDQFGGEVPKTREELVTLAGVGRKTANVVLTHCFEQDTIIVDTHVTRLSNRLGFVETTDAVAIEFALQKKLPQKLWNDVNHHLIAHGRAVCKARKPNCSVCIIEDLCPSKEKVFS